MGLFSLKKSSFTKTRLTRGKNKTNTLFGIKPMETKKLDKYKKTPIMIPITD